VSHLGNILQNVYFYAQIVSTRDHLCPYQAASGWSRIAHREGPCLVTEEFVWYLWLNKLKLRKNVSFVSMKPPILCTFLFIKNRRK